MPWISHSSCKVQLAKDVTYERQYHLINSFVSEALSQIQRVFSLQVPQVWVLNLEATGGKRKGNCWEGQRLTYSLKTPMRMMLLTSFQTVKKNNNNLLMDLNNILTLYAWHFKKIIWNHFHTCYWIWSFPQPSEVGWTSISSNLVGEKLVGLDREMPISKLGCLQ